MYFYDHVFETVDSRVALKESLRKGGPRRWLSERWKAKSHHFLGRKQLIFVLMSISMENITIAGYIIFWMINRLFFSKCWNKKALVGFVSLYTWKAEALDKTSECSPRSHLLSPPNSGATFTGNGTTQGRQWQWARVVYPCSCQPGGVLSLHSEDSWAFANQRPTVIHFKAMDSQWVYSLY